jgi:hypothetical protein
MQRKSNGINIEEEAVCPRVSQAIRVCSDDFASCIPGERGLDWQYTGGD